MASKDRVGETEFGGKSGILARAEEGHSSFAESAADRKGVAEAAMVMRRAGLRESETAFSETYTPETGIVIVKVPYSEEQARRELEERP